MTLPEPLTIDSYSGRPAHLAAVELLSILSLARESQINLADVKLQLVVLG